MKFINLTTAVVIGFFALTTPANSTSISYDLDFEFSGGDEPAGTPPWVFLTFDDGDTAGSVDLIINSSGLTGSEIISNLYFNFDDSLNLDELVFTAAPGNTATANSIDTGSNSFQADGDGSFDILIDYPPPPGQTADLFGANETIIYNLTSTEAILASSFDFFSSPSGGNGTFHAAAHIQRIGPDAEGGGWIGDANGDAAPVPEPATLLLFGVGTALVGFSRRRKR